MIRFRLTLVILALTSGSIAMGQRPLAPPQTNAAAATAATDPAKPQATDSTEFPVTVLYLKFAKADYVMGILSGLYSQHVGALVADERTNALFVRCDDVRLAEIEQLVKVLDTSTQQSPPGWKLGIDPTSGKELPKSGPYGGGSPYVARRSEGRIAPIVVDVNPSGNEDVFSFSIGFARESTKELRDRQQALEQKSRELAAQLRRPVGDSGAAEQLRTQLRDTVRQAFEARQALERAELAEFAQRLKGIQQSIEMRERIVQQIVDRRLEELLDPNVKWESVETSQPKEFSTYGQTFVPGAESVLEKIVDVPDETSLWQLFGAKFRPIGDVTRGTDWPGKGLYSRGGLEITELLPSGPAADAGLRVGDILVGIDRWETIELKQIEFVWQNTNSQESVKVIIVRGGQVLRAQLKWAKFERPADVPAAAAPTTPKSDNSLKPARESQPEFQRIQTLEESAAKK